jgi:hypothetical protein
MEQARQLNFLSAEIAASFCELLAMTCRQTVIASEQRERGNPIHQARTIPYKEY